MVNENSSICLFPVKIFLSKFLLGLVEFRVIIFFFIICLWADYWWLPLFKTLSNAFCGFVNFYFNTIKIVYSVFSRYVEGFKAVVGKQREFVFCSKCRFYNQTYSTCDHDNNFRKERNYYREVNVIKRDASKINRRNKCKWFELRDIEVKIISVSK